MNRTILKHLSAAACLAAASAGLAAQSAPKPAEVRGIHMQDPRPGVDIERRLSEVIQLLDADELTPAQREKAKNSLQELVERVRKERARGDARGHSDGEGRIVWRVGRPAADADVEVMEIEGDPAIVEVDPQTTVRARRIRVQGLGDGPHPDVEAHVLRRRIARIAEEHGEGPGEAVPPPAPPQPPRAPRAPEPPRELMLRLEQRGERGDQNDAELRFLVDRARAVAKRKAIEWREVREEDHDDADEHEDRAEAPRDGGRVFRLMQRERAADVRRQAADRTQAARAEQVEEVMLDDVTGQEDLRTMIDEMRAEMREVRALMERIREIAPEAAAPARRDAGRPKPQ